MTESVAKRRSVAIDMIKGLSILTLAFGHFESGCMNLPYNFFIVRSPAFFIVVGWLWGMSSHDRTVKEHWAKRKKGLVVPYLWFSLIFLVLDLILLLVGYIEPFVIYRDIYKTICLRGIGTLWFLPALLGGEMLFLSTKHSSVWLKTLLYILCFLVICSFAYFTQKIYIGGNVYDIIKAPFNVVKDIANCFLYLGFAFYFSRHYGHRLFFMKRVPMFMIGIVMWCIAFYLANFTHFSSNLVVFSAISIIYNILAGIGALLAFRAIENFKPISVPLCYFGKNSLIVMTMHWALYVIAQSIDRYWFHHSTYSGTYTLIYFGVAVFLLIGIIELINRKFRFIIGK